ncbi:hypothetical protein KKE92_03440 [Candidatus Micrarchaeota archaeon]|nr:hypothetical protein [Candidatus Micrarchaeota archaeon]MBU1681208.1 hypothetical protein [Candidatus Micrarchaeota archaeon]
MRKLQRPPAKKAKTSKKEPLAEGLQSNIPTDFRGRLWRKMTDIQIVEFARKVMREKKITGKQELYDSDSGLYSILRRRKLLDKVRFEEKQVKRKSWACMRDEELVEYTRTIMEEKGIKTKFEFRKAYPGLHKILKKRKLVEVVNFEEKQRSWKCMGDEELIEFAQKIMEEGAISGNGELEKADPRLHYVLKNRGLIGKIGFEEKQRSWIGMSDEELVEFTRNVMEEKVISGRKELEKADSGLYGVLRRRILLDEVGFEEKHRKKRSWENMNDDEIVEFARNLIGEKDITGRHELEKVDPGLYKVLWKRGLLGNVGFEEKQGKKRPWSKMSDEKIIEFAMKLIREKEISGRGELNKTDSGLYRVLIKRELLDWVFARADQQRDDLARDAVIDALEEFCSEE